MMRTIEIVLFLALFHPVSANANSPVLMGFSSIVPGLGQTLEGNPLEGLGWFSAVVGSYAFQNSVSISAPVAGKQTKILSQAWWDLWQYNLYDAYRDAKPKGDYTDHSAFANYISTFNPLNIIDPIGAPTLALWTEGFGAFNGNYKNVTLTRPFFFGFVGMGEEGLFRGFLFPTLSQAFKSKIIGALTSSLLFSLYHITNGVKDMESNFFQRWAMGTIFCWEMDYNKYDLRHGIFAHSWIDIINESGAARGESITQASFHIPLP